MELRLSPRSGEARLEVGGVLEVATSASDQMRGLSLTALWSSLLALKGESVLALSAAAARPCSREAHEVLDGGDEACGRWRGDRREDPRAEGELSGEGRDESLERSKQRVSFWSRLDELNLEGMS